MAYAYWFWPTNCSGSGVYVYIENGIVRYIGKTADLQRRLHGHHKITRGRIWSIIKKSRRHRLLFYPCQDPLMSYLEAFLIFCFQPERNYVQPSMPSQENYQDALAAMKEIQNAISK